jgi:hypothetical protein
MKRVRRILTVTLMVLGMMAAVVPQIACEDGSDDCTRSSGGGCVPDDALNM